MTVLLDHRKPLGSNIERWVRIGDEALKEMKMTKVFKGKVVGNNLRKDFTDYKNVKSFPSSAVEFELEEPFQNQISHFEITGFFPIGSEVELKLTVNPADSDLYRRIDQCREQDANHLAVFE